MLARQKALFDEWKQGREFFVTDGVVDEIEYAAAPKKLLFLLKEVNGGKDWDLCDFIRKGGRPQTWDNIARWVEGIFNLDTEIPWERLEGDKESRKQRRLDMLKKICVVNVKKAPGVETSVSKEIRDAGKKDVDFLRKQIDIYEPEIIICCGTDSVYSNEIAENKLDWQRTSRGIWYTYDKDRLVIAYSHPEARVQSSLLYYGLIDAVREILSM